MQVIISAGCIMIKRKYDSAIYFFKQSIAADPKFINAYNGIAKTFFEMKAI